MGWLGPCGAGTGILVQQVKKVACKGFAATVPRIHTIKIYGHLSMTSPEIGGYIAKHQCKL